MPVSDEQFLLSCIASMDGKPDFVKVGMECGMNAATGAVQIRLRRLKAKHAASIATTEEGPGKAMNGDQENDADKARANTSKTTTNKAKKRKVKSEPAEGAD